MKQVIISRAAMRQNFNATTTPFYIALRGGPFPVSSATGVDPHPSLQGSSPWSVAGTFSQFRVAFIVPAYFPFTCTWVDSAVELYVNGVASGLQVTIPGGSSTIGVESNVAAVNSAVTVAVSPGDKVQLVILGGSNSVLNGRCFDIAWSMTFISTNAGESGYTSGAGYNLINPHTSAIYGAPLNSQYAPFGYADVSAHSLIPLAASVFRYDVGISVAPGVAQTQSFALVLNGVVQDGSGGTIDTRMTISGASTTGNATFVLPVTVMDKLSLQSTSSAGAAATNYTYSLGVRAVIDGQYALCCDTFNGAPCTTQPAAVPDYAGVNEYNGWAQTSALAVTPPGPPTTESALYVPAGLDSFTLSGMIVELDHIPSGGRLTFTTRKNLSTPVSAPTLTFDNQTIQQTNVGSLTYSSPSDSMDMQCVKIEAPVNVHTGWTWLVVSPVTPTPPAPPVGTVNAWRLYRFDLQPRSEQH